MLFNVGNLVTRKSHNHDLVFKIIEIKEDISILQGVNVRLIADAPIEDLEICTDCMEDITHEDDEKILERMCNLNNLDRDEYFYLPGKILHIDADKDYLDRCMSFYSGMNILSYGIVVKEKDLSMELKKYLEDIKPDILVITGHDAYYDKGNGYQNINNYKNSKNFIDAVQIARDYEKDHEKLIIIAGACQSDYEELIKAGSNFASSPKRINIHALDPAIIASSVSLSIKGNPIKLLEILDKTKYGKDGIGGIITNGMMYVGYPR